MTRAPRWVVVANPDCRRLEGFQNALQKCGLAPAIVVNYAPILRGEVELGETVREGDWVRLESPGRDWEVEKLLLKSGIEAARAENSPFLSARELENLGFEKGRLWPSRQLFLGFSGLMLDIGAQLKRCAPHFSTHHPGEILTMCDKIAAHALLSENGVAVAPGLPTARSFEELISRMKTAFWNRAFLKIAHGSSASGVVAFQFRGANVSAQTTVEMVENGGQTRLYNSRQLRNYRSWREVKTLIDALCQERLHVEKWFPKASLNGKICDARVVVIRKGVWDGAVRLSDSPLTNLHLGNARAPLETLKNAMKDPFWQSAMQSCERAMNCFPHSLCGGVDLAFSPDFSRHAILEINVWGDLLPATWRDGRDAYRAQIEAVAN